MTVSPNRSSYWRGFAGGLPFMIVIVPFALLFGVIGTEAGLNIAEVMGFSVLVIAGASQIAALQLLADNAPTLVVLATSLAVNLRMAMYSAAMAPHLGVAPLRVRALIAYMLVDQSFAVSFQEFERNTGMTRGQKIAYFLGCVTPVVPAWYLFSLIGGLAGAQIPPEYAIDFAVPITFIALFAPMVRTLAHLAAVLVSITGTLLLSGVPYSLGLLIAATLAMLAGAQVELWHTRRSAKGSSQ